MANIVNAPTSAPYVARTAAVPYLVGEGEDDFMHYIALRPRGPLTGVASGIDACRFPFDCTIKEVRVYCGASSINVVPATFDINVGPAPGSLVTIFTDPNDRPSIAPGQLQGSSEGLDVDADQDWFLSADLDSLPASGVAGPVFIVIAIERRP